MSTGPVVVSKVPSTVKAPPAVSSQSLSPATTKERPAASHMPRISPGKEANRDKPGTDCKMNESLEGVSMPTRYRFTER